MTAPSRAPRVTDAAGRIARRVGILANPYFRSLQDGSMRLETFRKSQEQFFFAVTFFPRPMAALIARLPEPASRLDILRNLVEEHGEFDESAFHHSTFQRFLDSIGSGKEALGRVSLHPAVRAFNSVLTASCLLDEIEVGVGCLGIIEHTFADISAVIGKTVVARGWARPETLVHYKLHAEIDTRHAEEFFAVIEPGWDDPARRYYIEQGLELGAYVFDRLYRDLSLL